MDEVPAQRRLSAVMASDVVGYSRLMGLNETGTLTALKTHKQELIDVKISEYQGRIVKQTGDGMLVAFSSVVNAVACAVDIQRNMVVRNINVPAEQRIEFRIGVHLGDILFEDNDIFGDGVNVAARIESIAKPGGVSISSSVRDNVGNRLDLILEDRGDQTLKNIARPIRVFDILIEAAPHRQTAPEANARCTVAVLPFANMSGDAEQEYFSDGITEDIITNLSKISALGVMARNTSFQFKGRAVDVPQIARQLKVSHVLEGSVRKAGERVRVTAQLIDGETGEHLWAERYDRDLSDIFAVQDEISETIVAVLRLKLLPEEKAAIEGRSITNPQTYKLYLMARHYSIMGSLRHREIIVRICRRAVELDPGFAPAWALMSIAQAVQQLTGSQRGDGAMDAADRAIAIDPNLADAYAAKGRVLAGYGLYDEAMVALNRALDLEADSYEANAAAARCRIGQDRISEALVHLERAAAVQPTDFWAIGMSISGYNHVGDAKSAAAAAHRTLDRVAAVIAVEPDHGNALSFGVIALTTLGEMERADEWIERAMLMDPENSNMQFNIACALANAGQLDRAIDVLELQFLVMQASGLRWSKHDKDLDPLRDHPRFKAMIAAAEARLASGTLPNP
ncbi:MAG: adenylate/guanylate cyclase domain-containing protein [Pseudomonadota bacterium]